MVLDAHQEQGGNPLCAPTDTVLDPYSSGGSTSSLGTPDETVPGINYAGSKEPLEWDTTQQYRSDRGSSGQIWMGETPTSETWPCYGISAADLSLPKQEGSIGTSQSIPSTTTRIIVTNVSSTAGELQEQREYIIRTLKLEENAMCRESRQVKEEISIFLENWSAVNINDADYGCIKLMQYSIELQPGTTPIRLKHPLSTLCRKMTYAAKWSIPRPATD